MGSLVIGADRVVEVKGELFKFCSLDRKVFVNLLLKLTDEVVKVSW